jgi:hypothetical protein
MAHGHSDFKKSYTLNNIKHTTTVTANTLLAKHERLNQGECKGSTFGMQVMNSYPIVVTKHEGKRPCMKPCCRVVDNVKIYLTKNVWVYKLIHVAFFEHGTEFSAAIQ